MLLLHLAFPCILLHQALAFDVNTTSNLLSDLKKSFFFPFGCVFLPQSMKGSGLKLLKGMRDLQKGFMDQDINTAVPPTINTEACSPSTGLIVLQPGADLGIFKQLSRNRTVSKVRWIFLVDYSTEVEEWLRDVFIPLHCEVLLVRAEDGNANLSEAYHVANNRPLIVKPWGNWNPYDGLRQTIETFYHRRKNLQNITITTVMSNSTPFAVKQPTHRLHMNKTVFEVLFLMQTMLNFTTNTIVVQSKGYKLKNGSWTGVMGYLQRDEADLSLNLLAMTMIHASDVHFTVPLIITKAGVFVRTPDEALLKWGVFLQPFSTELWLCVLGTAFLIVLILSSLHAVGFRYGTPESEGPRYYLFKECLLYVWGIFCSQGHWTTPRSWSCRLVYWLAYVIAITLFAGYSANFIAFLSARVVRLPFNTLAEVMSSIVYSFGVKEYSELFYIFQNATDPVRYGLYNTKILALKSNLSNSTRQEMNRACSENYAFMGVYRYVLASMEYAACDISTLPKSSFPLYMGFALSSNNPYRELFNVALLKLRRHGILRRLYSVDPSSFPTKPPLAISSIDFAELLPLFLILISGVISSVIVALFEFLSSRRQTHCYPFTIPVYSEHRRHLKHV